MCFISRPYTPFTGISSISRRFQLVGDVALSKTEKYFREIGFILRLSDVFFVKISCKRHLVGLAVNQIASRQAKIGSLQTSDYLECCYIARGIWCK